METRHRRIYKIDRLLDKRIYLTESLMKVLKLSLTSWIFIGLFLGVLAGLIFGENVVPIADPLAQIFLRLLNMVIMPLIITSILSGVLSTCSWNNWWMVLSLGYWVWVLLKSTNSCLFSSAERISICCRGIPGVSIIIEIIFLK